MQKKTVYELITSFHIIISNIIICYIIIMLDRYSSQDMASDIGIALSLVYTISYFFINRKLNSRHNMNKDKIFIMEFFSILVSTIATLLIINNADKVERDEFLSGLTYFFYWLLTTIPNAIILVISILCLGIRKYKEFKPLGIAIIVLLIFLILTILWI